MKNFQKINIEDFNYDLKPHQIAKYPLPHRDQSKLLVYNNGNVSQNFFFNIDQFLPENSLLFFNETKVIQARLEFFNEIGTKIEIFCLEPFQPTSEIESAFHCKSPVIWKCFVKNSKKWKEKVLVKKFEVDNQIIELLAKKISEEKEIYLVEFCWSQSNMLFSQIMNAVGLVPLPPYLKRQADHNDKIRYQTVYARYDGSVAAPTAGLHFTKEILQKLALKNIEIENLTLHVGAGTFKPISSKKITEHVMHAEKIIIKKSTVEKLINKKSKKIIVVGTTGIRTLESLYWFGVKLLVDEITNFDIQQWDPYQYKYKYRNNIPSSEIFGKVLDFMNKNQLDELKGQTKLFILPGYDFKVANMLITNFHQPKSTLLLLIAAFIGNDWKKIYQFALENEFRFLSYGDSCLYFK